MIFFISGLKGVSDELYEAAEMDGANAWSKMVKITLPMLTPVIVYNLIMGLIAALQQFTFAYILSTFGASGMNFLALNIYNQAFRSNAFGYASALAVILFFIVMGLTLLIFKTSGKWVFYSDES
jgi:ABC-type sugar transport system permease subunit